MSSAISVAKLGLALLGALFVTAASLPGAESKMNQCMNNEVLPKELKSPVERVAEKVLVKFLACTEKTHPGNTSPCNRYLAQALQDMYGIKDFKANSGQYFLTFQMAGILDKPGTAWQLLGSASDQRVLDKARRAAESGQPTIAVRKSDKEGEVAIILPGEMRQSGSWGHLRVPNSASLVHDHPELSYVGCKLSHAFRTMERVKLYSRKKQP